MELLIVAGLHPSDTSIPFISVLDPAVAEYSVMFAFAIYLAPNNDVPNEDAALIGSEPEPNKPTVVPVDAPL